MFTNSLVKILLVSLSGVLLSFSAPGYDLWFLAWFFLAPLFIIINITKKIQGILFYSFLFGFTYNFGYLHWLFSIHPLSWLGIDNSLSLFISVLSLIIVSGYNALFFVLFSFLYFLVREFSVKPYNSGILNILFVTLLWLIIFNKISISESLLGFPWTLIEYSQYKNLFLIQIAEFCGSLSISFLIVFFNIVLAKTLLWAISVEKIGNRYIRRDSSQSGILISSFLFISVLIIFSLISGVCLYNKNKQKFSKTSQTVCILQGNLPLKVTRGQEMNLNYAKKIYSSLLSKIDAKLIIIPEGALPAIFNNDQDLQRWIKNLSHLKHSDIISGSYCLQDINITNCAVSYSPLTNNFSFYDKERLVPFGEFTPFSVLLPGVLKKLASNLIGDGFKNGDKKQEVISTSIGNAGVNICFELIFPDIIRKHVLSGANFLLNISDLSWFSNDIQKKQFLSFAVFRAIENRKWIAIASNNGISAFIEPSGKIKSQTIPNSKGVLLDWIQPNKKITFYSKYGW